MAFALAGVPERGRDVRHRARRRALPHAEEPRPQGDARVRRRRAPARPPPSVATSGSSGSRCSSRSPTSRRVATRPTSWRDDPEALVERGEGRDAVPRVPHRPAARGRRPRRRSKAARAPRERAAVLIAEHPNDLVRDQYVMKLAGRLDIDPDRLRDTVARRARSVRTREPTRPAAAPSARSAGRSPRARRAALGGAGARADERATRTSTLFADPIARERVRGADAAGRGTSAWSRRHPRSRRCCSGSRSKSRRTASRPTSEVVTASSSTWSRRQVSGCWRRCCRAATTARVRGQDAARHARERDGRTSIGMRPRRSPSSW